MNNVNLIGRLTKDVELKVTQQDKKVASFTLAVDKYGDGADFIQCVVWERQAEILAQYTGKGVKVGVTGRIQTRDYEDKTGRRVYVTEVVANQIHLIDSKKQEPKQDGFVQDVEEEIGGPTLDVTSDDLPF